MLESARLYPRVIRATGTSNQIAELAAIGWLSFDEAETLRVTMEHLRERKMMASLVTRRSEGDIDTADTARIFRERIGIVGNNRS